MSSTAKISTFVSNDNCLTFKRYDFPVEKGDYIAPRVFVSKNDDFLLYIGVADDENCRQFEEDFVPMLKKKNLTNVVYLNITDVKNKVNSDNEDLEVIFETGFKYLYESITPT